NFRVSIRGLNATSTGPWAAVNFTIASPLSAPTITAPRGTVANPVTVTWLPPIGARSYQVWLSDLTAHIDYAFFQAGVTGTSLSVGSLTPGDLYRVMVRSVDDSGYEPRGTAPLNFAVP